MLLFHVECSSVIRMIELLTLNKIIPQELVHHDTCIISSTYGHSNLLGYGSNITSSPNTLDVRLSSVISDDVALPVGFDTNLV